jgi:hypothetical protein
MRKLYFQSPNKFTSTRKTFFSFFARVFMIALETDSETETISRGPGGGSSRYDLIIAQVF